MPSARSHRPPLLVLAVLTALPTAPGCDHNAPPKPVGAAADAARDGGPAVANRGRRRRRRGVRAAGNNGAARAAAGAHAPTGSGGGATNLEGPDPGAATAEDLALADEPDNEPAAPRQRARMTETGPVLPEDLGRPQNQSLDMTQGGGGGDGPMGLEPAQISRGLNPLLHRLANCADATSDDNGRGAHGRVTVRLRIRPNGTPAAAGVSGGGGPPEFTLCVRRVVASARFDSFRGPDAFATWGFDVD